MSKVEKRYHKSRKTLQKRTNELRTVSSSSILSTIDKGQSRDVSAIISQIEGSQLERAGISNSTERSYALYSLGSASLHSSPTCSRSSSTTSTSSSSSSSSS